MNCYLAIEVQTCEKIKKKHVSDNQDRANLDIQCNLYKKKFRREKKNTEMDALKSTGNQIKGPPKVEK